MNDKGIRPLVVCMEGWANARARIGTLRMCVNLCASSDYAPLAVAGVLSARRNPMRCLAEHAQHAHLGWLDFKKVRNTDLKSRNLNSKMVQNFTNNMPSHYLLGGGSKITLYCFVDYLSTNSAVVQLNSCVPPFNALMSCIILSEVIPQSETSSARGDDIV